MTRPLAELPREGIRGVLFDIDDTLTTEGRLTPRAYAALGRLKEAGRITVAVTGRPAGWCDHFARMWPVDAVVGENGAFYFRYTEGRLVRRFLEDAQTRSARRQALVAIGQKILREVPGTALASDQPYREADLAIDYCEDVPRLPDTEAERIAVLMRAEGLHAKVSSIHVNGWFGDYDKLGMTRRLFEEAYGCGAEELAERFVFVGDSPNDAPMFAHFANSVGVANVGRFLPTIPSRPRYLTQAPAGEGFAELVAHLLES